MLPKKLLYLLFLFGIIAPSHALNVKITSAGGYQADGAWLAVATNMGHAASIVPVSTLDNNAFFTSTDILIVSTGLFAFTPVQVATIQSFLQTGKSVYLQGEYVPSLPGNQAFSQIVNAMGGSFTWGAALNGNLMPAVIGSMNNTNLNVASLPYFFYGCTGTGSCDITAFVVTGNTNTPVGWMFSPSLTNTGRLIFTTDQDWIGANTVYPSCQMLMKNVLYHLADKTVGDQNPVPLVSITVSPGNTLCENSAVTFTALTINAGPNPSYQWKKNGNNTGNNSSTYTSSALQNGDVLSCTVSGCAAAVASSNNITMTVHALDTIIQSVAICAGQLPYTWNGITVVVGGNTAATFTVPSTVTGCDSTTILSLTVNPAYALSLDTSICHSAAPYLLGNQSLSNSGSYTHTFTTTAGCDSIVTLSLHISDAPVNLSLQMSACLSITFEGHDYDHSTILKDTLYGASGCDSVYRTVDLSVLQPVYDTTMASICTGEVYSFAGGTYSIEGNYINTGAAANGCDSFSILVLTVHALPDIRIIDHHEGTLCVGDTLLLTATGGSLYEWSYENAPLSSGDEIQLRIPGFSNRIKLSGKDDHRCVNTEELVFTAEACCTLQMPNAFSPNGDGRNDKFGPVTNGHPEEFRMMIFNRWGRKIYTSFQADSGWDGTVSGMAADAGIYFYSIEGKCVNGSPIRKHGDLALIR